MDETGRTDSADFDAMVKHVGAIGVEYMNQKNSIVNKILKKEAQTA